MATFIGFVLANVAGTLLSSFPWMSLLLLLQPFGIYFYTIEEIDAAKRIQRRLIRSSHITDENRKVGWSIGCWYVMYLHYRRCYEKEEFTVHILATEKSYRALAEEQEIKLQTCSASVATTTTTTADTTGTTPTSLTVYQRTGSLYCVDYIRRNISLSIEPRPGQQAALTAIMSVMKTKGHCVTFLYGAPGTGKSMLGLLLAKKMNASYCNNLRVWQPGDTLTGLHSTVSPTEEKPLVVLMDEIDGPLMSIHTGIQPHKNIPILVPDKTGWNSLMDDIDHGMYPWTVLILTSNRSPEFFNGLDPSYMRSGRVDISMEITSIA